METDLKIFLRLLVAVVLAGIIGWDRESAGKAAGLRTHMLVGLGAALFIALGEVFVARYQSGGALHNADPLRVIEAVVTGVSFLGAGMIYISRGNEQVVGLTTAASVWVTAAVGIAAGLERYLLAAGVSGMILLILRIEQYINNHPKKPAEPPETLP